MNRLAILAILALTACTPALNTKVTTTADQARASFAQAKYYWGIAKGMAQVAEAANPALVPVLGPRITAIDDLVVQADASLALAVVDVGAIGALVAQIQAQAQDVVSKAAPAVRVVAGPVPKG